MSDAGKRKIARLAGDAKTEETPSLWARIKGGAAWLYDSGASVVSASKPVVTFGKNALWVSASVALLIAVPILVEMQREAMLAVEKQALAEQSEQMMQQLRAVQESQMSLSGLLGGGGGGGGGSEGAKKA